MKRRALVGCLLGTAVGDAIGLPYEGLSPDRAKRLLGSPDRHRFVFGHGMVSDDTEHAIMVARALALSQTQPEVFGRQLAKSLRVWLLGLPAGIGLATLQAIAKLWIGFPPHKSGVFSAGNGPCMRAPLLGVAVSEHEALRKIVLASTVVTHTDPKAYEAAFSVALAAQCASEQRSVSGNEYLERLMQLLPEISEEFRDLVMSAAKSVDRGQSTPEFAFSLGLESGVTGYVYHSVPICLHAWLANQTRFREAIQSVIRCGGDADTTAAIVGGIVGAYTGKTGIPAEWLEGLLEWPWNVVWLEKLAERVCDWEVGAVNTPTKLALIRRFPRNLFFTAVVILHGIRRFFPPY